MQLEVKDINAVLKHINNIGTHTGFTKISQSDQSRGDDYGEFEIIYTHRDLPKGVLMKVVLETDSYGDNEVVKSIQFGKVVEVFEVI